MHPFVKAARREKFEAGVGQMQRASLSTGEMLRGQHRMPDRRGDALLDRYRNDVFAGVNMISELVASATLRVMAVTRRGRSKGWHGRYESRTISAHDHACRRAAFASYRKAVGGSDDVEELHDHPLQAMLDDVNPIENRHRLWVGTATYLKMLGRAFWYITRDGSGVPLHIWPLLAQHVTQRIGDDGQIDSYIYGREHQRRMEIDPANMCMFRTFSPFSSIDGHSPLMSSLIPESLQTAMLDWQHSLAKNNAMQEFAVTSEYNFTADQKKAFLSELYQHNARPDQKGGFLFISGRGVKLNPLSVTPREMGHVKGIDQTGDMLLRALGVPPSLLKNEKMTRDNAATADLMLMRNTIRPMLDDLAEQINQDIVPMYDDTGALFVSFDDPTPDDQAFRLAVISASPGAFTKNEVRRLAGLSPIDELAGEFISAPAPLPPVPATRAIPAALRATKAVDAPGPTEQDPSLVRELREYFTALEADVIGNYELDGTRVKRRADLTGGEPFDRAKWDREFQRRMAPHFRPGLVEGWNEASEKLGIDPIDFTLAPNAERIQAAVDSFALKLGETTNATVADRIRRSIDRVLEALPDIPAGLADGSTLREISQAIADRFEQARGTQTNLIAKTETLRVLHMGEIERYVEQGVQQIEWLTTSDPCEFCATLNGRQWQTGTNLFSRGDRLSVQIDDDTTREMKLDFADVPAPPMHPSCILPGQDAAALGLEATMRSVYDGPALSICCANGERLAVTPNHPILTSRGWVAAEEIEHGDYLVRHTLDEERARAVYPHIHSVKALIENVSVPGLVRRFTGVPVSAEDFHGDGIRAHDIDVVFADGLLRDERNASAREVVAQRDFGWADVGVAQFARMRTGAQNSERNLCATHCSMGGGGDSFAPGAAFAGRHAIQARALRGGHPSRSYSRLSQPPAYYVAADSGFARQRILTLTGDVSADKVIEIQQFDFSGYVFDLQTFSGMYTVNRYVVHNCNCTIIPVIE